jgi:hypothetical protein
MTGVGTKAVTGGSVVRLAITGHRGLDPTTTGLVDAGLRAEIARYTGRRVVGLSCLADGADTLFARAVLDAGGDLVAVIPALTYRQDLPPDHHRTYEGLLAAASSTITTGRTTSGPEAHLDAGLRMIQDADRLLAVWDGQPARGPGGTADIVAAAHHEGLPVTTIWPPGAHR